jgi:hypothetical protein
MTKVKSRHLPETERRWVARAVRKKLIAELANHLSDEQQEVIIPQLCELTDMVVVDDRLYSQDADKLADAVANAF